MKKVNIFKSEGGNLLLGALFYDRSVETCKETNHCLFYLKNKPTDTDRPLIDARNTFIDFKDPTGNKWARKYLDSYAHFVRLRKCAWFKKELDKWLEEIDTMLQQEALDVIKGIMISEESADGPKLSAAKYIAEKGWIPKTSKGRPTKASVTKAAKEIAEAQSREDKDFERIKLKVVK